MGIFSLFATPRYFYSYFFLFRQIFPNGSLSVHRLEEGDGGKYFCSVQNRHGSDRIQYEVVVQGMKKEREEIANAHFNPVSIDIPVPPIAPELLVRNSTSSALELVWMALRSRRQPVLGYTVNFRREHGDWRRRDTDPLTDALWLEGLVCGANYSVYMTAYNHVGASLPSTIVTALTQGRGENWFFFKKTRL